MAAIHVDRDWGEVTAAVTDTARMISEDNHEYTVYRIDVETVCRAKWHVWRRYNDWKEFHAEIGKVYKKDFFFPADTAGKSGRDPEVVEERKQGLGRFLMEVMQVPNMQNDRRFREFLSARVLLGEETARGKSERLKSAVGRLSFRSKSSSRRLMLDFLERDQKETQDEERKRKAEDRDVAERNRDALAKSVSSHWSKWNGKLVSKQGEWIFKDGRLSVVDSKYFPSTLSYAFDAKEHVWKASHDKTEGAFGFGDYDGNTLVWRAPTGAMLYQYRLWTPEKRWFFDTYLHGPSQWLQDTDGTFVPAGGDPTYAVSWTVSGHVPPVVRLIVAMHRYVKSQLA